MSMRIIQADVKKLVDKELELANSKFPPFHSTHESWAVLHEEMDELKEATELAHELLQTVWSSIKLDYSKDQLRNLLSEVEERAVNAACEAIQVATMCRKFKTLGESKCTTP